MPIITEALKIYWGQRTECEDNDDKLFSKTQGYRGIQGVQTWRDEVSRRAPPSSRMAHLSQQLMKQRKQKTCLDEQGAPNLNEGRKHKNHIMAWEP